MSESLGAHRTDTAGGMWASFAAGVAAGAWAMAPARRRKRATCRLYDACSAGGDAFDHESGVTGRIDLESLGATRVLAKVELRGLSPGAHGLHVHRHGDFSDGCASTCAHYDPMGARHGGPLGPHRHRGDFGNVHAAQDGTCTTHVVADVTIDELLGRAFVVHADPDDYGLGAHADSATTGHSGRRVAGGVIVRA